MSGKRILLLKDSSHLGGKLGRQSAPFVDGSQLEQFRLWIRRELRFFAPPIGGLCVGLCAHRDVLAYRHSHRTSAQRGHASGEDLIPARPGCSYPDQKRRSGYEAVISTQHGGPEPTRASRSVLLEVGEHR